MATETKTRTIENEIIIDATPEQVWKALTDPGELVRWFPLEARVTPGVNGEIFMGWGEGIEGASRILSWEPGRRLTTSWFETPGGEVDPRRPALAVEYTLEGKRGSTVLRLVHSGFLDDGSWDEEFEGTRWGWAFELRSLRHYLQHHPGKTRRVVRARIPIELSNEEAAERIWSPAGLLAAGERPSGGEGDPYRFTMASGHHLEGKILYCGPATQFGGSVENLGNSLFRVLVEKCGPEREAWLWLSTWGMAQDEVERIEQRWTDLLRELFA